MLYSPTVKSSNSSDSKLAVDVDVTVDGYLPLRVALHQSANLSRRLKRSYFPPRTAKVGTGTSLTPSTVELAADNGNK